jgi:hypothetical protein
MTPALVSQLAIAEQEPNRALILNPGLQARHPFAIVGAVDGLLIIHPKIRQPGEFKGAVSVAGESVGVTHWTTSLSLIRLVIVKVVSSVVTPRIN